MSDQGVVVNGAATVGDAPEPVLKRRRLLDAGGPIEDDEKAHQKMRDAEVYETAEDSENRTGSSGFDLSAIGKLRFQYGNAVSPMGYFCMVGDLPMMRWLYVNGADTRDTNVPLWFPMRLAAINWNVEACKWLYEHGAAEDIKRRARKNKLRPLVETFGKYWYRSEMSHWLILNGALCMNDGSGNLDRGLMRNDLDRGRVGLESRRKLLEWANEHNRTREAFLVFLMGTLSPPEYSPSALRNILLKRLLSDGATDQILGSLPCDQHQMLWTNLIGVKDRLCLANCLVGASGVLEMIADYVGIVRGREARIIRQLTEILPDLNAELDQKYENDSSDEEDDSTTSEEDDSDSSEEDE